MDVIERIQRREERRRRTMNRQKALATMGMALTFTAGFAIGGIASGMAPARPSTPPAIVTEAPEEWPEATGTPRPAITMTEAALAPAVTEPEPEPEAMLDVPLQPRTQIAIYSLCDNDDALFCAVMAIASKESRFNTAAIGDGGKCIGMMQINYAYHTERMKKLGVTDLTDPVQCASVAIDYLRELSKEFNSEVGSHVVLLAYNRGPAGAREFFEKGIYSSKYTWEVMELYEGYLTEIGGQDA